MKTTQQLTAIAIALLFSAIGGTAQTNTTVTTTEYVPTTTVVGARVVGVQGEEFGQITDVVLDEESGCMAYVVLSVDQNGARKTVAAPWAVLRPGTDSRTFTVQVDREKIINAPAWEGSRIAEYSRTDWVSNVYSYYGVQPQVGVNIRRNTGTRYDERNARQETQRSRETPERPGAGSNPDTLTQPPRGQQPDNSDASPTNDSRDASEPSPFESRREKRANNRRMMHEGASPAPSPEQSSSESRANRSETRGHAEQSNTASQNPSGEAAEGHRDSGQSRNEPPITHDTSNDEQRKGSPQPSGGHRSTGQTPESKPTPTP
jgi:sporulation protein YlmC with PRC-barrel domain